MLPFAYAGLTLSAGTRIGPHQRVGVVDSFSVVQAQAIRAGEGEQLEFRHAVDRGDALDAGESAVREWVLGRDGTDRLASERCRPLDEVLLR